MYILNMMLGGVRLENAWQSRHPGDIEGVVKVQASWRSHSPADWLTWARTATAIKPLGAWLLNTLSSSLSSLSSDGDRGHASYQHRGAVNLSPISPCPARHTVLCSAVPAPLTAAVLSLPWDEASVHLLLASRSCTGYQKQC
jgi:hypothetical protein